MATQHFSLVDQVNQESSSTAYRDGAHACRAVLRMLPSIDWLASSSEDESPGEYFVKQQAAIAAILSSAGPLSEQAAGAMAVLAEFIVCSEQDGAYISLSSGWKPWAAMTKAEQTARMTELSEYTGA